MTVRPKDGAVPGQDEGIPTVEDVVDRVSNALFGKRLIVNVVRAAQVEAIVALALPSWTWCSTTGYSSYDFVHPDGTRLEIKQSAARQSWVKEGEPPSKGIFDIAAREGFWEGADWFAKPGRNADINIMAHHAVEDIDLADHRDPSQWTFYVLPTAVLPAAKTISIAHVRALTGGVGFRDLRGKVEDERRTFVTAPMKSGGASSSLGSA